MILPHGRKNKQTSRQKAQQECERQLRRFAFLGRDELYKELGSTESGLTVEQAEEKLDDIGKNVVESEEKHSAWHRLREAVINPFTSVLLAIAVISYITDVASGSDPDYITIGIILFMILISSAISFVQSQRSNAAAKKLFSMVTNTANIIRDDVAKEIPIEDIVPGDILKLSAGDMIPGDVRFLTTKDMFIAQAALTGESNPVEKFSAQKNSKNDDLTDLKNLGFVGTNVVSGTGKAIVLTTGNNTYFGTIAKGLETKHNKTSFERGVNSIGILLLKVMFVMIPIVFIVNTITKGNMTQSLLFSISIAVGLTPEMLPVIMASTLARGAVSMSRQKVIVKQLGAIQTFGEMDILCTDKTGTLTEDKIVLEKYMDPLGADDMQVLSYAYLNSHFQTGLNNLIDSAIINRAEINKMKKTLGEYRRVDEIPFDFSRRRMSVVLENRNDERFLITKGAVKEIMDISTHIRIDGKVRKMTDADRELAMKTHNKHDYDGLRMIAVAEKDDMEDLNHVFGVKDESNMTLIGFIGFLDPPKESAAQAIETLTAHGVRTVVLTGDTPGVAVKVCERVGINTDLVIGGREVEMMTDDHLVEAIKTCCVFTKLSPAQKERVVIAFQTAGHTVGYMGDGINDALPLNRSDVGISVDNAVDIAKETADIILLKKDLMVLERGVLEGRKTFGNIIKYIKMAVSGNFGNMFSVLIASIFLPFLPMLPIHIIMQNLLNDSSQIGLPFDNVDPDYAKKPRKWSTESIKNFMLFMGPLSSIFDILCFGVLWWIIGANTMELAPLFQAGWFVFGTVSQIVVIYMIRTARIPFLKSHSSTPLVISTAVVTLIALLIVFTGLSVTFNMHQLPIVFFPWLILLLALYMVTVQIVKQVYVKKFGSWL